MNAAEEAAFAALLKPFEDLVFRWAAQAEVVGRHYGTKHPTTVAKADCLLELNATINKARQSVGFSMRPSTHPLSDALATTGVPCHEPGCRNVIADQGTEQCPQCGERILEPEDP